MLLEILPTATLQGKNRVLSFPVGASGTAVTLASQKAILTTHHLKVLPRMTCVMAANLRT